LQGTGKRKRLNILYSQHKKWSEIMPWHKNDKNNAVWYLSFLLNKIVNKRVSLSSIFLQCFVMKHWEMLAVSCILQSGVSPWKGMYLYCEYTYITVPKMLDILWDWPIKNTTWCRGSSLPFGKKEWRGWFRCQCQRRYNWCRDHDTLVRSSVDWLRNPLCTGWWGWGWGGFELVSKHFEFFPLMLRDNDE